MTKEKLAAALVGVEYGQELGRKHEAAARAAGLVVVSGVGDHLMTFRGAIHDELDAIGGQVALVDAEGVLPPWKDVDTGHIEVARTWFRREAGNSVAIEALWCSEGGYFWTYRTDLPHATFDAVENGEPCCRGIVFALADLPGATVAPDQAAAETSRNLAEQDVAAALRWSGLKDPAMLPVPSEGRTLGWVITTYDRGAVEKAWSEPTAHGRGSHEERGQVRKGGIRLYRSERDAWIALRIAKERQFASALAGLDARIGAGSPRPDRLV